MYSLNKCHYSLFAGIPSLLWNTGCCAISIFRSCSRFMYLTSHNLATLLVHHETVTQGPELAMAGHRVLTISRAMALEAIHRSPLSALHNNRTQMMAATPPSKGFYVAPSGLAGCRSYAPTIAHDRGGGLRPQINQFAKEGSLGFQIAP